jgi:sigma-B regulation protein RsbU (phosphoserine phosphatase)
MMQPSTLKPTAEAVPGGSRPAVLIVDDDPVITTLLAAMVSAAGYAAHTAANGVEAWAAFQRAPASVVISDWLMPELDGMELCRRVRARPDEPYVYFILITASGGKQQYAAGMEAGADDFIFKPLDLDELRARLRVAERILGLRRELRRLEGLLPICSYCKRIHDASGTWSSLEEYVERHTEAQFSHGICEECFQSVVQPQLDRMAGPT